MYIYIYISDILYSKYICIYIHIYLYTIYLLKDISKTCLTVTRIEKLCQTLVFVFLSNYQFATKTNIYKEIYIQMYIDIDISLYN